MKTPCLCQDDAVLGAAIAKAVADVQFGTVELVIHEGRIVQLERHEKIRLDRLTRASERANDTPDVR